MPALTLIAALAAFVTVSACVLAPAAERNASLRPSIDTVDLHLKARVDKLPTLVVAELV
jgi:hypothetical protein